MDFICPTCGERMPRDLEVIFPHTEKHIEDLIKRKHPEWVDSEGVCEKCMEYYRRQLHPED